MSAVYSNIDQYDAMTAANAAADGTKEAAYLSVWQSRIGSGPRLALYREATLVWSAQASGLLPISGSSFVVPVDAEQLSIAAADIDTGDWEFRVENAADASIYLGATVTKAGGTDVLALSDDTVADGSVTLGSVVLNAPSLDTVTTTIGVGDARVVVWVDPNYTFATQPTNSGMQIRDALDGTMMRSLSEPGIIGAGAEYTFSRETDPYTGAGKVFRHRIDPTFPLWGSTQRSQWRSETILDGTVYWLVHQFRIDSDWTTVVHGDWRDSFGLGDIHHNSWTVGPYGKLPYTRAPIELAICSVTPSYTLGVWGNYTGGSGAGTSTTLFSSGTVAAGEIHKFVVRFRVARSWAQSPLIQIWRQVDAGAQTLIADRSDVMIGYADMVANGCYLKVGAYGWVTDSAQRTTYTKGAVMLKEEAGNPTITAAEMFALLGSL